MSLFKSLLCWTLVLSFLQYGTAQQVPANATPKTLIGYATDASATEQQWEQKFRAIPEPDQVRENMRRLSAFPHHVGSAYDKDNAEWMLAKFKAWGFDAQIETFDVLYPTPLSEALKSSYGSDAFTSTSRKSRTNFFTSGGETLPWKAKPDSPRTRNSSIRYW